CLPVAADLRELRTNDRIQPHNTCPTTVPEWRNWQTRWIQNPVPDEGVWVRLPPLVLVRPQGLAPNHASPFFMRKLRRFTPNAHRLRTTPASYSPSYVPVETSALKKATGPAFTVDTLYDGEVCGGRDYG